jgi:hypothetical protein
VGFVGVDWVGLGVCLTIFLFQGGVGVYLFKNHRVV